MTPVTQERVVCGLNVTLETGRPAKALTKDDLPTFGAPTTATAPQRVSLFILSCAGCRSGWPGPSRRPPAPPAFSCSRFLFRRYARHRSRTGSKIRVDDPHPPRIAADN